MTKALKEYQEAKKKVVSIYEAVQNLQEMLQHIGSFAATIEDLDTSLEQLQHYTEKSRDILEENEKELPDEVLEACGVADALVKEIRWPLILSEMENLYSICEKHPEIWNPDEEEYVPNLLSAVDPDWMEVLPNNEEEEEEKSDLVDMFVVPKKTFIDTYEEGVRPHIAADKNEGEDKHEVLVGEDLDMDMFPVTYIPSRIGNVTPSNAKEVVKESKPEKEEVERTKKARRGRPIKAGKGKSRF